MSVFTRSKYSTISSGFCSLGRWFGPGVLLASSGRLGYLQYVSIFGWLLLDACWTRTIWLFKTSYVVENLMLFNNRKDIIHCYKYYICVILLRIYPFSVIFVCRFLSYSYYWDKLVWCPETKCSRSGDTLSLVRLLPLQCLHRRPIP